MALAIALVLPGCGAGEARVQPGARPTDLRAGTASGPMTRDEAERYVLALVNADRAEHGLPALAWDETAARAARRHAEDMAAHGFTAHWGTDGSVPELRFTEAGGEDAAFENVGCFVDGMPQSLALDGLYLGEGLLRFERAFMAEVPPNDGHRRNILSRWHTGLGVGVALPRESIIPCVAQEFVDDHGSYAPLPRRIGVGDFVEIKGELRQPAELFAVGVARIDAPLPRSAESLNRTRGYVVPDPYELFAPRKLVQPFPRPPRVLSQLGNGFSLGLELDDGGKPGLYEISVWARLPGAAEARLVSLRTVHAEPRPPR
jgi:uncharacterized protein YkwD